MVGVDLCRIRSDDDLACCGRPRLEMLNLGQNRLGRIASLAASLPALSMLNLGGPMRGCQVSLTDVLGIHRWESIR